jgi:hypothetical protein
VEPNAVQLIIISEAREKLVVRVRELWPIEKLLHHVHHFSLDFIDFITPHGVVGQM